MASPGLNSGVITNSSPIIGSVKTTGSPISSDGMNTCGGAGGSVLTLTFRGLASGFGVDDTMIAHSKLFSSFATNGFTVSSVMGTRRMVFFPGTSSAFPITLLDRLSKSDISSFDGLFSTIQRKLLRTYTAMAMRLLNGKRIVAASSEADRVTFTTSVGNGIFSTVSGEVAASSFPSAAGLSFENFSAWAVMGRLRGSIFNRSIPPTASVRKVRIL